jgi:peptidoglycan/LPS O-acetylase OafA/YrhL
MKIGRLAVPKEMISLTVRLLKIDIQKGRETDLDVVRGIAILLAMGWHFNRVTHNPVFDAILWPGRHFGWAGVDLFFVLSGFLVGRLVFKEIEATGGFNRKRFFLRRALKLWPTLYIFLLLMTAYEPWQNFIFQIGFHIQNYFRTPVATHLWSLAVEEHFYILFALAFPAIVALTKKRTALIYVLVGVMTLSFTLRLVGVYWELGPIELQIQTQFRIDAISCGVLLAIISLYFKHTFARLVERKLELGIVAASGALFLSYVDKDTPLGETFGYTVSYASSAALLLLIYRSGIDVRFPKLCRAIALIGVHSYAIYIWHVPAGKIAGRILDHWGFSDPAATVAIQYSLAIAAGFLATRFLEMPILRFRNRLAPAPVKATEEDESSTEFVSATPNPALRSH